MPGLLLRPRLPEETMGEGIPWPPLQQSAWGWALSLGGGQDPTCVLFFCQERLLGSHHSPALSLQHQGRILLPARLQPGGFP